MRIDYDHLRRVVAEMKQGVAATTRYSWLDLAQAIALVPALIDAVIKLDAKVKESTND